MNGKILCAVAFVGFAICAPATAQTPSPDKLREAYDIAIKCNLADVFAAENRQSAHDKVREDYYNKKGVEAVEAGRKVAALLGYSTKQYVEDFWARKDEEWAKLAREPGYFSKVAATCKSYGLM